MSKDMSSLTVLVKMLSAAGARLALDAAEKVAAEKKLRLSIAVVDIAGNLVAFHRMDNAAPSSVPAAMGKAKTAANLGGPTKLLQERLQGGAIALLAFSDILPAQGGVPITIGGVVVGAIGASGGSGADDEMVALAGASAVAGTSA